MVWIVVVGIVDFAFDDFLSVWALIVQLQWASIFAVLYFDKEIRAQADKKTLRMTRS